jgi:hypothetical protein
MISLNGKAGNRETTKPEIKIQNPTFAFGEQEEVHKHLPQSQTLQKATQQFSKVHNKYKLVLDVPVPASSLQSLSATAAISIDIQFCHIRAQ